jgi:cell wall-associated NlpC family hydrolase
MTRANNIFFVAVLIFTSCNLSGNKREITTDSIVLKDSTTLNAYTVDSLLDSKDSIAIITATDSLITGMKNDGQTIDTRDISPEQVIEFAQTLLGTPYVYGSTDPKIGFDCSGFITYVFNHFGIKVPRSSKDFINIGTTVPLDSAKPGDLILFTDPDFDNTSSSQPGHIGLITSNENGNLTFIHSTSGKAMSVANSNFSDHYKKRFIRVGRVFHS